MFENFRTLYANFRMRFFIEVETLLLSFMKVWQLKCKFIELRLEDVYNKKT